MLDSLQSVIDGLKDRSSEKRRRSAKQIAKNRIHQAGTALYSAFLKERSDSRTWETQAEMVRALGVIENRAAIDAIQQIVIENQEHDMLTIAAATAYCRLARRSKDDVQPVLKLLESAGFSVATGALLALGCDRVVPTREEITRILEYASRFGHQAGFGDPRYGAAVAAAGWDGVETERFLQGCISSRDSGVVHAAQSSLKRKYVKCR